MPLADLLHLGGAGDEQHLRGTPMSDTPTTQVLPGKLDDLTLLMAAANPEIAKALLAKTLAERQPLLPARARDMLSRLTSRPRF